MHGWLSLYTRLLSDQLLFTFYTCTRSGSESTRHVCGGWDTNGLTKQVSRFTYKKFLKKAGSAAKSVVVDQHLGSPLKARQVHFCPLL